MLVYNDLFHYAPNSLKSDGGGDHDIPPILNGGGSRNPNRLFRGDR